MQFETFSSEPLQSLSDFHETFDEIFVKAIDVPNRYLISIVKTRLGGAAS